MKAWTRRRFGDVTVMATEMESALPGFPQLQTLVAFWSAERKHYHFKIFKPLEEVREDDVPPAWYKDALPDGGPGLRLLLPLPLDPGLLREQNEE